MPRLHVRTVGLISTALSRRRFQTGGRTAGRRRCSDRAKSAPLRPLPRGSRAAYGPVGAQARRASALHSCRVQRQEQSLTPPMKPTPPALWTSAARCPPATPAMGGHKSGSEHRKWEHKARAAALRGMVVQRRAKRRKERARWGKSAGGVGRGQRAKSAGGLAKVDSPSAALSRFSRSSCALTSPGLTAAAPPCA